MSVNPDDMNMANGVAEEYVDLEHQVIRQKSNFTGGTASIELLPGDPAAEFDPGERKLDREEVAQLVYYRRLATVNFLQLEDDTTQDDAFCIVDASIGINGDLFRPVTTQESFQVGPDNQTVLVDTGGEIGLLDNYQVYASPSGVFPDSSANAAFGGAFGMALEHDVNYYDWPTGGPIVDSFDTITAGFGAGYAGTAEAQFELRYDLFWDVAEQGRSTNPFGRPSTR